MPEVTAPQREYPVELIQQRAVLYSTLPGGNDLLYIGLAVAGVLLLLWVLD